MSLGALHALAGLQQLERLTLDLTHCRSLTTDDLTATLALLCRAMPSLSSTEVRTDSVELDADVCVQSVREQLSRWGTRPPWIQIADASADDSDSEDSDSEDSDSDDD